jgi:hypothetical protein|tara:strand:- start:174 stop:350 length:177 start_codon:yes stop_codon:yes gene_type:complete
MLDKLRKQIIERQEQLKETLAGGGIQNFESYHKIVGEISSLSFTLSLIKDLHKDKDDE